MELPFPFPGSSRPVDRFQLHGAAISTFTYMGRSKFEHLLHEVPVPEADIVASNKAAAAGLALPTFFPPIPLNPRAKSNVTFVYGTIGWGKVSFLGCCTVAACTCTVSVLS